MQMKLNIRTSKRPGGEKGFHLPCFHEFTLLGEFFSHPSAISTSCLLYLFGASFWDEQAPLTSYYLFLFLILLNDMNEIDCISLSLSRVGELIVTQVMLFLLKNKHYVCLMLISRFCMAGYEMRFLCFVWMSHSTW